MVIVYVIVESRDISVSLHILGGSQENEYLVKSEVECGYHVTMIRLHLHSQLLEASEEPNHLGNVHTSLGVVVR